MKLTVKNMSYQIENVSILKDINLNIESGEFVGLIGPNGSGKSSLLKTVYRVAKHTGGSIFLNETLLSEKSSKNIAKELSVVSQEFDYGFDFTVREIVTMGRYPQKEFYEMESEKDKVIVDDALQKVGLFSFKERSFFTLSGGEKQRVLIARAIAQQTDFIIMDEPTNHLDIGYQFVTMDLIKALKKTVLTALHDLNMAIVYCNRIYVLKSGQIVAEGPPQEVLTESLIQDIYHVDAHITYNDYLCRKLIIFKSEHETNNCFPQSF